MSYDGFISYSHAADDELAPRLQAGLQRFAKPWWQRRALRIFRDESSLAANPHLWDSITEALDTSGWFVLLLSPDAAGSEWVNQEVAYWLEHREADRIIPVVTTGEFGWDGSDVTGDCVPEALRGVFESEPRWVDARELGDPETLDLQNPKFAAVVADLAAPLRGIPKDELAGEEVRQHKRTVRTAWAAGVAVLVLAVAAAGFGIQSARNATEAERQTELARDQASLAEANAATALAAAERADRTARRLIGFVLAREGDGTATLERPTDASPRALPPTDLPVLEDQPASIRLDFRQETCSAGACFLEPAWVDEDRGLRITPGYDEFALWTANTAFHVRHGFVGLPVSAPAELLAEGYAVRLFLKLEDAVDTTAFRSEETYLYEATALLQGEGPSCGPELFAGSEECWEWTFDFPEGLPAGVFSTVLEWSAPCSSWFETDVCDSPARPISLSHGGGFLLLVDEEYKEQHPDWALVPDWPFDPWADSEPLLAVDS